MLKSDRWIRKMSQEHDMINPFSEKQVRDGVISYGLSSYGYDLRVADEFKRLVDREHGIVVANVTSAQPLEPADLAAIAERVQAMAGARVEVQAAVDPELIGGLTVRVGDRLIDASVRGRLARLRDSLVAGAR